MSAASSTSLSLVVLLFVILLPIVPAYFLFKALPSSSASVGGPLQGLQIKLGGAFAGYFAVVLLVFFTHSIWAPPPVFQVWELDGTVTDESGAPIQRLDPKDINLLPPLFQGEPNGAFKLTFVTTSTPAGGGVEYPRLSVSHENFREVTLSLDPSALSQRSDLGANPDTAHRRIEISHIALPKADLPPYSAAGQPPTPIPAGQEHQP
jgi:hypothetical protein